MNKKAQGGIELSTSTIIKLVVAVLALIVLWTIGANLMNIFITDSEDATLRNFERLASTIKDMNDGKYMAYPLYVDEDYVIVGYPTGENEISGECDYGTSEAVTLSIPKDSPNKKPLLCGTSAEREGCLCLCKKTKDPKEYCQNEEEIVSCKTAKDFEKEISFVGGVYRYGERSCPYALLLGTAESQSVYIKRNENTVNMCTFECVSTTGESTASSTTPTDIATPSSGSSVLIIGDSQSMGTYGDTLYSAFKNNGYITNKYAVCGSTPSYFTKGSPINSASCNAEYVYDDGTSDTPTSGSTPLLDTLIKEHSPALLVVTFASNMYGSSEETIQSSIATFTEKLEGQNVNCYWVGPPQGPRYDDLADYQQYKEIIKESAETGGCTFIDSEQYTAFAFCGDTAFGCDADVHFDSHGAEGKAAAQAWAQGVYAVIVPLVS